MLTKEQIIDAGKIQDGYEQLFREKRVTKKNLEEVCHSFSNKYSIPLIKAIKIAKSELTVCQVERLFEKKKFDIKENL